MPPRHSLRLSLALLLLTFSPLVSSAQERPDPTAIGNGARHVGLGGAITAVTDDLMSIGWNPAGLSYLRGAEFGFVARGLVLSTGAKGSTNNPTPSGYPRYSATGEFGGALDFFEFVGLAVPFKIGGRAVTAGVAHRRFAEGLRPGSFRSNRREANGRYFSTIRYFNEGGIFAISPSLGVEVTQRLRLGVTANVLRGSSEYRVVGPTTYRSVLREENYSGMAIETGAMFQVNEDLRIGAQLTLPHDRSFTIDNDTTQVAATREAPMQVSIGFAKRLSPKTVLSSDIRYAPWSGTSITENTSGDSIPSQIGVRDAMSLHVGWERDVTNDIRGSTIRVGGFVRTTSFEDLDEKQVSAIGVSIGQSWYYELITFEMGVALSKSTNWVRSRDPLTTTITLTNNDFVLSLGMKRHIGGRR